MKQVLSIGIMLMLAGCASSTSIQRDYHGNRNECQDMADDRIEEYLPQNAMVSQKDRNAQLLTLFSDCMFTYGWTVATPDRDKAAGEEP